MLDVQGNVLDGDARTRQRLARSPSLVRRLLRLGRRAAALGGCLDHDLEPALRVRVFASDAQADVVVFFGAPQPPARLDPDQLTRREREVVAAVAGGRSDERIAARLRITVATLRWHLTNVYRKTGLRSRAALQEAAASLASRRRTDARERARGRRRAARRAS